MAILKSEGLLALPVVERTSGNLLLPLTRNGCQNIKSRGPPKQSDPRGKRRWTWAPRSVVIIEGDMELRYYLAEDRYRSFNP